MGKQHNWHAAFEVKQNVLIQSARRSPFDTGARLDDAGLNGGDPANHVSGGIRWQGGKRRSGFLQVLEGRVFGIVQAILSQGFPLTLRKNETR
jgi:hypothetical protein